MGFFWIDCISGFDFVKISNFQYIENKEEIKADNWDNQANNLGVCPFFKGAGVSPFFKGAAAVVVI